MFTLYGDTEQTELNGGLSRRILAYGKDMMAVEVKFEQGAIGSMHSHPPTHRSSVLEGEFSATVGEQTLVIKKGDTYYTEPNVPHGVVCIKPGTLLDVFTPMREDFVK